MKHQHQKHCLPIITAYPISLLWAAFSAWVGVFEGLRGTGDMLAIVYLGLPAMLFCALAFSALYSLRVAGTVFVGVGIINAIVAPMIFSDMPHQVMRVYSTIMAVMPFMVGALILYDVWAAAKHGARRASRHLHAPPMAGRPA